jgi:hypothetical protein
MFYFYIVKCRKKLGKSLCYIIAGVPRHGVGHCNGCVKFELNDKSLHTEKDSEQQ